MAKPGKEKGFILVILLALLLLLAVTAMSLNFKAGMQGRMAANRTVDVQTYLGQLAVIEQSLWKLTGDPSWRVPQVPPVPADEYYEYPDPTREPDPKKRITYTRTVTNSAISSPNDYRDVVTISVRAPNATRTVNKSFRYNIDTVAGTGLSSPQGMATYYDAVQKTLFLYIADPGNHCIWKLDTATKVIDTVAGTTGLNSPRGVATYYDSFQKKLFLYIADSGNHRIYKLDTATNAISTVVNTSGTKTADPYPSSNDNILAVNATLNSPTGVAVDASGNIYIADKDNNRIRKFTDGGYITTFAGGFTGVGETNPDPTKVQLVSPSGVFVDMEGNIYIADTGKHKIRKITATTPVSMSTVAGTGTAGFSGDGGVATMAQLSSPQRVFVDTAKNIYIADTGNHRLRIVNHDPIPVISTLAGTGTSGYNGDNQPAVLAQLNSPGGVALGLTKAGNRIFISDTNNNRIRILFLKTVKEVYGP